MSFYKDIGKSSKDLFEDDFFLIKKFQVKTKNDSQFEVCTEGELLSKGANASLSITRKALPLSLDKLKIKSNGRVQIDASLKTNSYSKFLISAEDGKQEAGKPLQSYGKFGCEFNFPTIGAIFDLDFVNGPIIKSSVAYKYNKAILFGTEFLINSHIEDLSFRPELSDVNIGIAYQGPGWNVSSKTTDFMRTYRFTYLHNVSPTVIVGTQIDYKFKTNTQKMALASQIKLDDKSTLKTKIDSAALLTGSFQHRLSDFVKMTLCAEVDLKDLTSDSHKFGIGLNFE